MMDIIRKLRHQMHDKYGEDTAELGAIVNATSKLISVMAQRSPAEAFLLVDVLGHLFHKVMSEEKFARVMECADELEKITESMETLMAAVPDSSKELAADVIRKAMVKH